LDAPRELVVARRGGRVVVHARGGDRDLRGVRLGETGGEGQPVGRRPVYGLLELAVAVPVHDWVVLDVREPVAVQPVDVLVG
jgi:hypothetical protein